MENMTIELTKEEKRLITRFTKTHNLDISTFIINCTLEKIEDYVLAEREYYEEKLQEDIDYLSEELGFDLEESLKKLL